MLFFLYIFVFIGKSILRHWVRHLKQSVCSPLYRAKWIAIFRLAMKLRDMNSAYLSLLGGSEQQRIEKLELFDEFPEWHLKCAHYTLVLASNGDCSHLHKKVTQEILFRTSSVCQRTLKLSPVIMENFNPSLSRYGHASVVLTCDTILLIGGYGPELGKHS